MFRLNGKNAIVTGGIGGLGISMLDALLEYGAKVVVLDKHPQTSKIAAARNTEGQCEGLCVDLANREDLLTEFELAMGMLGGVDILLNCAGINIRHAAQDFPYEDWKMIQSVNLDASFLTCQHAARYMMQNGGGSIINVASMNSFIGGMQNVAYAASKGGIASMTKTLANEWGQYGIRVNAIAPGYMDTPMNTYYRDTPEGTALRNIITPRIPLGRWGVPDDLKGVTVFLASEASAYVSGVILPVDGGFLGR